jgi:hypothetical protein
MTESDITISLSNRIRLCASCTFEFFHADGIFQELLENKEMLTYSYWYQFVYGESQPPVLFDSALDHSSLVPIVGDSKLKVFTYCE